MNKTVYFTFLLFIFAASNLFAMGSQQTDPGNGTFLPSRQMPQNVAQARPAQTPDPGQVRAEQIMKAVAEAYPQQIERVEFRNGDWAVLLRGTWFFYAGGRMLPQNLLGSAPNYSPQPFYNYTAELPQWVKPSPEVAARIQSMANNRNQNPPRRSAHFFDTLWRASNHAESYDRVKTLRFLGKSVTVHYLILENLSLIEEEILSAAKTSSQVQSWVNNISSLEGWSWRNIADTQSRSFHSYGLAVDIIPRSYGGREAYWLWATQRRDDWWNISYNERHHPPPAVIKIFEKYGFVWGGKWLYFDTIHFEYRPEVLILSGMSPETRR